MKSMHEMTGDHECEVCVNLCFLCVCAPVLTWLWHLWTARLLISWCVFGLCSHSYCIYGCVSAHLTNHTHSHSLRLRLPSPHCHLTYKSLRLFYCQFISLPLIWKTRPSYDLWRSIRVCVLAFACGRASVKHLSSGDSVEEQPVPSINRAISWNVISLSIPCFPTLSFLMTVISAHWSGSKCFSRSGEQGVWLWWGGCGEFGMWCAKREGTQVQSVLRISQGLLQHTWPLLYLSSLCGLCVCTWLSVFLYACVHLSLDACWMCRHHSSWLCVYVIVCVCACVCAQACQLRCASSVERSSQSDHEGYFLTLISPEIFFFSPRSLFPLSLSSMFLFLQVPLSQNRGNSTASGCTEVTLFQSRPKFSKSHPGARL